MEEYDSLQDPYLDKLDLKTSENLKLYNKAINVISESDRYDLTRSKWTYFYQELEDDVFTFGYNSALQVVIERDPVNVPTESKNIIHSYNSITQAIIESHCEKLWAKNTGAGLGHLTTANYGAEPDYAAKQDLISQKRLRPKMLGLWINNDLTTEAKSKLRAFKTSYNFNNQYEGDSMLFVIVKIVRPDARSGCSDIKNKLRP